MPGSSSYENKPPQPEHPEKVTRRFFLKLSAAVGAVFTGKALGVDFTQPVAAQSYEEDKANEELKTRRKEWVNALSDRATISVNVAMLTLKTQHNFAITEDLWQLRPDAFNWFDVTYRRLMAYANFPENAHLDFVNPEYLPVLYGEQPAAKYTAPKEVQRFFYDETVSLIDVDRRKELLRSLAAVMLPTQPERLHAVKFTQTNMQMTEPYSGIMILDAAVPIDGEITFKQFVHELCHIQLQEPKYISEFADKLNPDNKIFLMGYSYEKLVELTTEWLDLFSTEFDFLNERFFLQEGDYLKGFIESKGGVGILESVLEIQAMLLTDALTEDISVFESYPPRVQELLLKYLSQGMYVQENPPQLTKDDLVTIQQQIAQVGESVLGLQQTEESTEISNESATDAADEVPIEVETENEEPAEEVEQQPPTEQTPEAPSFDAMKGEPKLRSKVSEQIRDLFKKKSKSK